MEKEYKEDHETICLLSNPLLKTRLVKNASIVDDQISIDRSKRRAIRFYKHRLSAGFKAMLKNDTAIIDGMQISSHTKELHKKLIDSLIVDFQIADTATMVGPDSENEDKLSSYDVKNTDINDKNLLEEADKLMFNLQKGDGETLDGLVEKKIINIPGVEENLEKKVNGCRPEKVNLEQDAFRKVDVSFNKVKK